ncbi:conidial yellow pigment biosynthesis polyketide synthase [Aspergillus udagawae]|uniref:Conidial yellow pigment biosynthesis polyketide synthase n=1 Tax=Aspergillus udagawae TaxID=91492 RepID=A0A8H3SB06_9EURO|nr:conidial yellow pigment biosynthesis polyketide synthase [Aspergillus udagawae]
MEDKINSTLEIHRVAFFGGQGSRAVFSQEASTTAIRHVRRSRTAGKLLASCYNAFLQELSNVREQEHGQSVLPELAELTSSELLLSPPTTQQSNPIIQGVSLLVQQLLSYLNHAETCAASPEPRLSLQEITSNYDEVVGFCSGVIPALVVATSTSIEDFIQGSDNAVRLAFWIGYRVASFCEDRAGPQWRARPWSIALSGLKEEDVVRFNSKAGNEAVCFSARINPDIITVTGTPSALEQFKIFSQDNGKPIPVHGWYHGGDTTKSVVQMVLQDIKRRSISFPAQQSLYIPLRSTVDGSLMTLPGEVTLTETAVKIILTHRLNWPLTWESLSQGPQRTEVHAFGPHSRSFFGTQWNNTRVVDHSLPEMPKTPHADIAIVGMSVNFPSADNKEALWNNLVKGINTVQTIPETRFKVSEFISDDTEGTPGLRSIYGNFVEKPWAFDHAFFDISPREARSMDPQQKLLLQATLHALDDAGYVPDSTPSFQKDSFGCYVGIATGDYVDNLRDDIDVYYSTGTLRAFLSGRISYNFKFSGPSMVVDTACSASSIAIYQACQALINGDCTAAIAGGANAMVSPDMYMGLGRAHFLSPTGQCKAFDAGADGYCRSEGCGVFVLKRLSDALQENDRIYGVIRGIAVSQSANASSITRPHSETQGKLFRTVLSRAGVDASSVDVVEAHGTGTQAGDAVEISSIQSVFGKVSRHRQNRVFVTSIKGNIGHAEAASGAASLAKVLLMLKNHRIPPQVGLKNINPRLADALATDMQITTEGTNWIAPAGNLPRRAMVNNFGAAGSNAAMIVEEAPSRHSQVTERSAYPFLISARTIKALKTRVQAYRCSIEASRSSLKLRDICYTATARRQRYEHIVSIPCGNVDDLLAKLRDPLITRTPLKSRPIIMVFSGQGGAYSGMGRELLSTSPVYRACVDRCEIILEQMRLPSIRGMLVGDVNIEDSDNTYLSQTGTFVLEYALASVWREWGIEPQAVIGHSLGEYAAMVIAGVMSLADGLRLVATRATLIADLCAANESGMMACNQSDQELLRLISHHESLSHLQVACQNTPHDSVIAGPIIELQLLAELCKQSGYKCKILTVPYGFHSAAMDPILEELRRITSSVTYYPAKILVGSTVYGDFLSSVVDSDYFVRQTRDIVRFAQLLQAITADPDLSSAVFLEIGPSPLTLPMVRNGVSEHGEYGFLSSLNSKLSAWESLSNAAVSLSSFCPDINWRAVFDGSGASLVDAPAYPLEQFENFLPYRVTRLDTPKEETTRARDALLGTGLLTTRLRGPDTLFETPVEYLASYIDGHVVGEVALCPASIYHEMVVEAASLNGVRPDQAIVITDLTFDNPLVYDASPDDRIVQLRLKKEKLFQFSSYSPMQPDNCTVHCWGTVSLESIATTTKAFTRKAAMIQRQLSHLKLRREHFDTFNTSILYETIFSRVVRYAESYRSIRQLTVADTGLEGYGTFKLPIVDQKCILSPTFIDTLLHSVGFMANNYATSSEIYICTKVESAQILFHDVDQKDSFSIYCSLLNCDENMLIADSYALSSSGRLVAAVEGIHFKKLNLRAFRTHLSRYRTDLGPQFIADSSSTVSSASSEDTISTGESPLSTPPNGDEEAMSIAPLVTKVVSKICGINLGSSSSSALLSELGIDSLMAIEIGAALQKYLPMVHLESSIIMGVRTIGELTREVEDLAGKKPQLPTEIRSKPSRRTSGRRDEVENVKSNDSPDRSAIKGILAGVCGVSKSALRADQSLSAYGLDSLLSIEFRQAFKEKLKVEISADQLHDNLTIRELEDLILGLEKPRNRVRHGLQNSIRPVLLQKGNSDSVPLILVHDGSGSVAPYSKLKRVPFPLYGISSPSHTLEGPTPATLKETAELYADAVRSKFDGPVIIGGWSFGGVLAFEIAQHLMSQVAGLIFIDSPSPINHQPLPDAVIRHVLQDLDAGIQVLLRRQFISYAAMLGEYRPSKLQTPIPSVLLQCEQTLNTTELCKVEYPWLENEAAQQDSISQWNTLLHSKMLVLKIPGNHFEPFKLHNVTKVTERLVEAYNLVNG